MVFSLNIEELFHSYHRSLLTYLRGLVKSPHFAEEIAQDTYLRLHNHIPPTTTVKHPRAYLFRTAHNLAMDQLTKQSTEWKYRTHHDIPIETRSPGPSPESITESRERLQLIANAINELPAPCRQAFILNKIHHMPHAEIALHLQVSKSMIEKHLMRALAHCRDRVHDQKATSS